MSGGPPSLRINTSEIFIQSNLPHLGRGVVVAPEGLHVAHAGLGDALVRVGHVVRDDLAHRVLDDGHLDEEALRDRDQRLVGPRVEPVKHGAVDQRGELRGERGRGGAEERGG